MKFSTRMLLMAALLSVSFLASASPPTTEPTVSDSDQVSVSAVAVDTAAVPAIRHEEDMPMLQRGTSQEEDQRLCEPTIWPPATVHHQRYKQPYATANSGIGRHTQHRT